MGKTYYVSSGGSGQNIGTKDDPFTSLQAAADKVDKGDTVLVNPGIYSLDIDAKDKNIDGNSYVLNIKTSGIEDTKDANGNIIKGHITFKSAVDGVKPVINVRNYAGIQVLGSYVDIDGFQIIGNRQEIIEKGGGTFEGGAKYAKDLQSKKAQYPSDPSNPDPNELNTFNPITSGYGIVIGSNYADKYANNVTIKNSIVQDCTAGGIAGIRADNVTIENNRVFGNSFYSPSATSGISFYQSGNNQSRNGLITIKGNTVYGNKNFIGFDDSPTKAITDGNGIIIDDNAQTQSVYKNGTKKPEDLLKNVAYLGKTLIQNNEVYENGGSGISAFNSSNVEISGNNRLRDNYLSQAVIDPKGTGGLGGQISVTVEEKPIVNDNSDPTQVKAENINISNNNITYSPNTPSLNIGNGGNGSKHVFAKFSLSGSSGADTITLNSLGDNQKFRETRADGGAGNDVLTGSNSTLLNKLFGGDGNDTLNGTSGTNANQLFGGNGDDILYAGEALTNNNTLQYNSLSGEKGNDTIHCDYSKKVKDIIYYNNGDGIDTVYNFNLNGIGNKDKILFSGINNIDVVTKLGNTEFRVGDGILNNQGFGTGTLLVTTASTTGFGQGNATIGTDLNTSFNLLGSNFTFS